LVTDKIADRLAEIADLETAAQVRCPGRPVVNSFWLTYRPFNTAGRARAFGESRVGKRQA